MRRLSVIAADIGACRACSRLVRWREHIAREKRARYKHEDYWGKPVPGFGDPLASLVIVGLAPGAHGANRTGRIFTGDRSGDFLYAALHRAGIANQPESTSKDDGLSLKGAFITLAARCAPPDNKPTPKELAACTKWLDLEIKCVRHARIFLALGAIAWDAMLLHWSREGLDIPRPKPRFAHDAEFAIGGSVLCGSYHVSQQNTQTGRLTSSMFDRTLARAIKLSQQTRPAAAPLP